ncbi:MAG TPA: CHAT domain-containing protein, partial [Bacteroidota bacterium]
LTLLNLARAYRTQGRMEEALQSSQQSRDLYATMRDSLGLRGSFEELGREYLDLGRYREAAATFTKALDFVGGDNHERILFLTRSSIALREAGDVGGSLHTLDEAYRIALKGDQYRDEQILVMTNVGHVYFETGALENAREFYRSALNVSRKAGRKLDQGYLLLLLGDVEREMIESRKFVGSLERAVGYTTEAGQLFGFLRFRRGEAAAKYRLGILLNSRRDRSSAVQSFKEAIELEEDSFISQWDLPQDLLSDPAIFNGYSYWYDAAVETLIKLQRTEEALWYLERKLQHRYQLLWYRIGPRMRDGNAEAELDSLRTLRRRVDLLEKSLVLESSKPDDRQNAEQLEDLASLWTAQKGSYYQRTTERSARSPNVEWLIKTTAAGLPDIQAALPDSTALLEFALGEDEISLILVGKNVLAVRSTPVRTAQALRVVRTVLENIGKDEEDIAVETSLRECYRMFFQPLERALGGLSRLIIVPPPELEGFPFHACFGEKQRGPLPYVAGTVEISYLPVAAALLFQREASRDLSRVFSFGNASGTEWDVEYQFKDMRSFFPKVTLIMGDRASLNQLKALQGDMLYMSSQFSYDQRNPEKSFFRVASDQGQGVLAEVSIANLSSLGPYSLVFLSNEGQTPGGLNFVHAQMMLLGGSRYVIANLWPHERRACKRFTDILFSAMVEGSPMPEAVQQAQYTLSRNAEFSTPRLWALFFLFGV